MGCGGWIIGKGPVLLLGTEALFLDTVSVEDGDEVMLLISERHKVSLLYMLQKAELSIGSFDIVRRSKVHYGRLLA